MQRETVSSIVLGKPTVGTLLLMADSLIKESILAMLSFNKDHHRNSRKLPARSKEPYFRQKNRWNKSF